MSDVRPFSPMPFDLALVNRLAKSQFLMDTTTALVRGVNPLESALLAAVPLADLGLPTLVLREDDQGFLGQIRHRLGDKYAHLACLAPVPNNLDDEGQWLQLLNGLVQTAGRRGAQIFRAEVSEKETAALHLLRRTGFLVYTRQTIYRHRPEQPLRLEQPTRVRLRPASERDVNRVLALQGNIVPGLAQQAVPCIADRDHFNGFVAEASQDGRLLGYLEVVEGKAGYLVKPFLHPDIFEEEAARIIGHVLASLARSDRLPAYVTMLSFQEWLRTPLEQLGLEESDRQAVLVKHLVARVRATDSEEIVQAAREIIFGSVATAIEINIDQDSTP